MSTATKSQMRKDILMVREAFNTAMVRAENQLGHVNDAAETRYWQGVYVAYEDARNSMDYLLKQWEENQS